MTARTDRAAALAHEVGARYGTVASVTRFATGLCHHVFDVDLGAQGRVVVRVADPEQRRLLVGALAWSARLRPRGVPLPEVLDHDVRPGTTVPYLVLERLPGTDLGLVHDDLTVGERRALAIAVVEVQAAVQSLGPGGGYGYSAVPEAPAPQRSWGDVVEANLRRSGERFRTAAAPLRDLHGRVSQVATDLRTHLDAVAPLPFLDDLTTKNVLVDGGRLSGVVDVDVVCFGDPLATPALTRASLAAGGSSSDYVEAWLEALEPDEAGRAAFDLYTAVSCLDIASEHGVVFNRDAPSVVAHDRTERLLALASVSAAAAAAGRRGRS